MPIYTYQCDNCGVRFDRQQKFTDPMLTRCPECSKKSLRKVFTPVGIVFKGSGFYATDHRSPSGSSRGGKPEGEEKSSKPAETDNSSTSSAAKSSSESSPGSKSSSTE